MGGGRCEYVVVEGTPGPAQRVYVVASNVPSLAGVRFGIVYAPDVFPQGWTSCIDGAAIDSGDWPASGSSLAFAADAAVPSAGPDDMVLIGYFDLSAPSAGVFAITPDLRIGAAQVVDGDLETHELDPIALGRVDVTGTGLGFNPCGLESTPAPPTEEEEEGSWPQPHQLWTHFPDLVPGGRDYAESVEFVDPWTVVVLARDELGPQDGRALYALHVYDLTKAHTEEDIESWNGYRAKDLWTSIAGQPPADSGPSAIRNRNMTVDDAGRVFVTGIIDDNPAFPYFNTLVCGIDPKDQNGTAIDVIWDDRQEDANSTQPMSIVEHDGSVYTSCLRYPSDGEDVLVEKRRASDGFVQWSSVLPVNSSWIVGGVVDAAGDLYVAGRVHSSRLHLTKARESDGARVWNRTLDLADHNGLWLMDITMGPDGYIYVTGWAQDVRTGYGTYDALVFKFDSNGNQLYTAYAYDAYAWEQAIDDTDRHTPEPNEFVNAISVSTDGWVYLAGHMVYGDQPATEREMLIRLNAATGEPQASGLGHWPHGGCYVPQVTAADTQLLACETDSLGAVVATGDWFDPQHYTSEVMHSRRRPARPGLEPDWIKRTDGVGPQLRDTGYDIAFSRWWTTMGDPQRVEDYVYCSVGTSLIEVSGGRAAPDAAGGGDAAGTEFVINSRVFVSLFAIRDFPSAVSVGGEPAPVAGDLEVRSGPTLLVSHPSLARGAGSLDLFDAGGRRVRRLATRPGSSRVTVSGLAPGVYFVRMRSGGEIAHGSGVVIR